MATIRWADGNNGNWSANLDWTGGVVPIASDDVVIAAQPVAAAYTVAVDGADAANSISLIAAATLQIDAAETLALAAGTGAGANLGTITVGDGGLLSAGGTFDNAGHVIVQGGASTTSFQVSAASLTLTGGGSLVLTDAGTNSQITAASAGDTLVNADNTIVGAGIIGSFGLVMDNRAGGIIDANAGDRLTLETTGSFFNEGLLEATGGSGLLIASGTTISNTGTILANGANVYLDGSVAGGTLSAQSGTIDVEGGSTASISSAAVTPGSVLAINDNGTLDAQGVLTNAGTIVVGGASSAPLFVSGSTFQVVANNSPDTFTQTVTLAPGTTQIDGGTVDLTVSLVASGADEWLVFRYDTVGGGVLSQGGQDWSVNEAGLDAAVPVNFSAAYTQFFSGNTVLPPTSSIFSGYSVATDPVPGESGTGLGGGGFVDPLPAGPVPSLGTFINPWSFLNDTGIDSTQVTGYEEALEFSPQSSATATELLVSGTSMTLSGGGDVRLDDTDTASQIGAASAGNILVNADNTISGSGVIGSGGLALDNQVAGVIDASGGLRMTLDTSGSFSNEGLIESTGGGLQISGNTTISGPGSIVANGGDVFLDGATISGGTVSSLGGNFVVEDGNAAVFSGATITEGTNITVGDSAQISIADDVSNGGTIEVIGSNAQILLGTPSGTPVGSGISLSQVATPLAARFLPPQPAGIPGPHDTTLGDPGEMTGFTLASPFATVAASDAVAGDPAKGGGAAVSGLADPHLVFPLHTPHP